VPRPPQGPRRPVHLLADDNACALPLLCLFIDRFGTEGLSWSPITIHMELRDELQEEITRSNFDKLMAGVRVVTGNDFYKSLPEFLRLCLALSGGPPDGLIADCVTCAVGMTEAMLINPPDEHDHSTEFSPEIRAYLGHALDQEGIMTPPDVLKLATRDKGDMAQRARHDFADDPEMYAAVFGVEKEKTKAIDQTVRDHVRRLLSQLKELPLENGNAEKVATKLLANLDNMHDED